MNKTLLVAKTIFLGLLVNAMLSSNAQAVTKTTTTTGGNWSATSTWVGNTLPGNGDSVIIAGNVTQDLSATADIAYVKVASPAILTFPNAQKIRMLNANSLFVIATGATVTGGNGGSQIVYPSPGVSMAGPFNAAGLKYSNGSSAGFISGNVPLPVTLTSFTGSVSGHTASLIWTSANETNEDYYVIEKSADSRNYTAVATVNPSSIQTGNKYQYNDNELYANQAYYRIKVIAKDGSYTNSTTLALQTNQKAQDGFSVYPNPAKEVIRYTANYNAASAQVTLVDMSGKVIWMANQSIEKNQSYSIDLSTFSNGIYHLSIATTDGNQKSVTISKQ